MYRVYCLKNKTDKIVYVGYTSRSLHDRWRSHKNVYPDRATLKIELIQEVETKEQAKTLEVLFQKQYNTFYPNGLNIAVGHINHDGSRLIEHGKLTRFGIRKKTEQEELKRVNNLKKAIENQRKRIRCINTGIEYESISQAAILLNLSIGNLSLVLKGKRLHTKGLRFEYCPIKTHSN